MPAAHAELLRVKDLLEKSFRDMQDLEFTIEDKKLYLLQTRNGKRTGFAAVRIAADMVDEGLISEEEAVLRVEPEQLDPAARSRLPAEGKSGGGQGGASSRQGASRGAGRGVRPDRADGGQGGGDGGQAAIPSCSCAPRLRRKTSPG